MPDLDSDSFDLDDVPPTDLPGAVDVPEPIEVRFPGELDGVERAPDLLGDMEQAAAASLEGPPPSRTTHDPLQPMGGTDPEANYWNTERQAIIDWRDSRGGEGVYGRQVADDINAPPGSDPIVDPTLAPTLTPHDDPE